MFKLKTDLLPHQQPAVDKLYSIRVGALYMEMGTGKTRTALEFIARRLNDGKIDKVLWLCPCSVKRNLITDLHKHCEGFETIIRVCGIESLSGSQCLGDELLEFALPSRTMLIVDESNLVKNPMAIRTRQVMRIAEHCPYRMILNGTPISKNEADLFAQWYIMDWRILGYRSYWSFARNHLEFDEKFKGRIRRVLNVDYLTDKIAPYSYEIKKEDCLDLPSKRYQKMYFTLAVEQYQHYCEQRDAFLNSLLLMENYLSNTAIYRTFTVLQQITSGRRITSDVTEPICHEAMFPKPEDNPRVQRLLDVVDGITQSRVVVWCRFQHEIDDVSSVLRKRFGTGSVGIMCGKMSMQQRMQAIEQFQSGQIRFLVANKACAGYGLNLQCCCCAIYYNNDWDWATRAQSEDRLHRLGQVQDVSIVDIVANGTIDDRVISCLTRKENLADWFRRELKDKNDFKWLDGSDEAKEWQG